MQPLRPSAGSTSNGWGAEMTTQQPTVVFFPEGAFGPTNNCVGIADVLRRRGARCVFVVEESFAGTLEAKGFEEARMRLKPPPEVEEEPGQFWKDFVRETAPEFRRPTIDQLESFSDFCMNVGAPRLPEGEFIWESPFLNLYLYPVEADYARSRPLAPTWHRLDSCVRATDAPFEMPDALRGGEGGLVYLSLGSLGSADVDLMERLVKVLAATPHRYIVSKGPQHALIELADNMWGREFLPQTSILPRVDLVITHGGNNTVTECLHFGKPMIVLPLFWDQHDNAQRVEELRFGERLPTYAFEDADLTGAIDRLLEDDGRRERMTKISSRLQSSPG